MSFDRLKKAAENSAKELGVSEYELYYSSSSDTTVTVYKKEVSSFSSVESAGICVRVREDGKIGYASSELLTESEIARLMECAKENARSTEKEDTVGIFEGSEKYESLPKSDFNLIESGKLKELALLLQEECYAADERVTDGTLSALSSYQNEVRISNSKGLDLKNISGINAVMAQVVVKDGDDRESGFEVRRYDLNTDLKEIAKKAAKSAIDKMGADVVKTGKYNVVISGRQMKSILSAYSSVFSAKAALSGMSLLAGKEGERVASSVITITDDPAREEASVKVNFDAEGAFAYRKTVIEDGILKTLLHNRDTAKRKGVNTTANASKLSYSSPIGIRPYAFCIEAGEKTLDELFSEASDGIYITEVKGLHAGTNPVTGDFSIESAGFMIENGKRGKPIKSFTVAGNFFDLLKSVSAVSNELVIDVASSACAFGSPDVLVKNMSIAGK